MHVFWRLSRRISLILPLFLTAIVWAQEAKAARLHVIWRDTSNNEDGFKIERRKKGDEKFVQVATRRANVTSYTDSGLTAGTTYCYRVRAFNAAGDSAYSHEACGTPGKGKKPKRTLGSGAPADERPDSSQPADLSGPRKRPRQRLRPAP